MLLCVPLPAFGQPVAGPGASALEPEDGGGSEGREGLEKTGNRINLRIGMASSDDNGRPAICLEVRAVARLSFEGCGTGNGFLHRDDGGALTHFRAKWAVDRRVVRGGVLRTQLGFGMTELQIATDKPGFVLRPEAGGVEAVGPGTSVGLQWLRPVRGGWEVILNTSAGMAWVPGAGDLQIAHSPWQPFIAFEVGAGW